MSRCRFAALLANSCRTAGLIWPRSSSAPPTSAASRPAISVAYPESAAPTETPASEAPRSWIAESKKPYSSSTMPL